MSVFFLDGDNELWNPTSGTARLAVAQLRGLESEVGVASGVGDIVVDEVTVDPVALEAFIRAGMGCLSRAHGRSYVELYTPPFAVAVGLCLRTSVDPGAVRRIVGEVIVDAGERMVR